MTDSTKTTSGWFERKLDSRARRALERQLEFQKKKASAGVGSDPDFAREMFLRSQGIRKKLSDVRPITDDDRVLEVGSGAHGLVFGFGSNFGVGVDPLAAEYKKLFPKIQTAPTVAAQGERLPFADSSFEIVISDNVIDHARDPIAILYEIVRVMKPGGVLYFTVNVHHPVYEVVSRAHGFWNAIGLKFELSPFADHTVHFSERRIREVLNGLSVRSISHTSTVRETKKAQRNSRSMNPDALLKKVFFKNALFELIAVKD